MKTLSLLAITALSIGAACGSKPPPKPPEPTPTPVVEAPPPKTVEKPPPKCESTEEACTAKSDTKARIKKSGYVFGPPENWAYSQEDDATIASTGNASVAVGTYEGEGAAKLAAARDAAFELLVKKLGVTTPRVKVQWARPAKTSAVGELKVSLWQAATTKADKPADLLVFSATLPDKSVLLGVGFVAKDDTSDADKAILKAIDSIGTAPTKSP